MAKTIGCWIALAGWLWLGAPAQGQVFSISGIVASNGQGVAGIPVLLSGDRTDSTTTDQEGTYRFTDVLAGTYTVEPIHADYMFAPERLTMTLPGSGTTTPLFEASRSTSTAVADEAPSSFLLAQNYPNPFNPSTTITFRIAAPGPVRLDVVDLLGRTVAVLVEEWRQAGAQTVVFDAHHLPSGLYVYRLRTASAVAARTMVLMR